MSDMFENIKRMNEVNPNKFYFIEAANGIDEDGVPCVHLSMQVSDIEKKEQILSEKRDRIVNSMEEFNEFARKNMKNE